MYIDNQRNIRKGKSHISRTKIYKWKKYLHQKNSFHLINISCAYVQEYTLAQLDTAKVLLKILSFLSIFRAVQ